MQEYSSTGVNGFVDVASDEYGDDTIISLGVLDCKFELQRPIWVILITIPSSNLMIQVWVLLFKCDVKGENAAFACKKKMFSDVLCWSFINPNVSICYSFPKFGRTHSDEGVISFRL